MILSAETIKYILAVSSFLLLAPRFALAAEEARKLLTVVDYIGGDYKNAVQAGKVIHPEEYREMKEFSQRSLEIARQLDAGAKRDIEQSVKKLAALIDGKADEKEVTDLSREIKEKLIKTYKIVTYPRTLPSLQAGKTVFMQNCAQCHGEEGKGDGPGRATMNPKEPAPADFTDPNAMNGLSPFKAFNVISFGVEGTAMPNFSALIEEERWQTAFYVLTLRFTAEEAAQGTGLVRTGAVPPELLQVFTLSTVTDGELRGKLKTLFQNENQTRQALAYLRRGLLERPSTDTHPKLGLSGIIMSAAALCLVLIVLFKARRRIRNK